MIHSPQMLRAPADLLGTSQGSPSLRCPSFVGALMPFSALAVLLIGVGGAIGSIVRFGINRLFISQSWTTTFPWPTFLINVSGSFLLGFLSVLLLERMSTARREWHLLLGTGFCGGYTTFSTFSYETLQLMRSGRPGLALIYAMGSVLAGFIAVWLAVRWTEAAES